MDMWALPVRRIERNELEPANKNKILHNNTDNNGRIPISKARS